MRESHDDGERREHSTVGNIVLLTCSAEVHPAFAAVQLLAQALWPFLRL